MRLAVALDRRNKGAISSVNCQYDPNHRSLHLELLPKERGDDCALELWSLDYKKEAFEEEYNVKITSSLSQVRVNSAI